LVQVPSESNMPAEQPLIHEDSLRVKPETHEVHVEAEVEQLVQGSWHETHALMPASRYEPSGHVLTHVLPLRWVPLSQAVQLVADPPQVAQGLVQATHVDPLWKVPAGQDE